MLDVLIADYRYIRDHLINGDDELIITDYLECMIIHGDTWPGHFKDIDVFNKNPGEVFNSQTPTFVVVKPRTENCGKTDGCESGSWRIIGRDKLIKKKSEETEKILGFKKILKFCKKTKPREYKRSWVMEEYRVVNKLNWKQDHVICKIRLLFEEEISSLLSKHFSYLPTIRSVPPVPVPVPADHLLPGYGYGSCYSDPDEFYLRAIYRYEGIHEWPKHVTNDVDRLPLLTLVDPQDKMFQDYGTCIFVDRKSRDRCCWIVERENAIRTSGRAVIGYRRVLNVNEKSNMGLVQKAQLESEVKTGPGRPTHQMKTRTAVSELNVGALRKTTTTLQNNPFYPLQDLGNG